jgi:hypothetical protein
MKHSSTWSALILIASALLLSAAPRGSAQEQSPRPTIHLKAPLSQKRKESPAATQTNAVSPSATAVIQPTETSVQTPVADDRSTEIQQSGQHKKLKEFDWIAFWGAVRTILQILFTLITTVATVYLAIFTYQLVTVTGDLHRATQTGTEVARENMKAAQASAEAAKAQLEFSKSANEQNIKIAAQSAEAARQNAQIARLALDIERPYIFIESREVSTRNVKGGGGKGGFAALLLTTNEVEEEADADYKQISLSFGLRNRGRGVAIVQAVKLRLIETPTFRRLGTTGVAGMIPIMQGKFGVVAREALITTQSVVGSGEVSVYDTVGMAVPIADWRRLRDNGLPAIVVCASYVDTTKRRFRAFQRFSWIIGSTNFLFVRPKTPQPPRHR